MSIENAILESKDDVKRLFDLSSDDFTALDLTDFRAGRVGVNVALLRISAAISRSGHPNHDLEELMKIYNHGGLTEVLGSPLYRRLMQDVESLDINKTLTNLGIHSDITSLSLSPFARAGMSTMDASQVFITLIGTTFNTTAPDIGIVAEGGSLSIVSIKVSDDNKTAILDMNDTSSCNDMNVTFTVKKDDLTQLHHTPLKLPTKNTKTQTK